MSSFLELVNAVLQRSGQETVATLANAETPVIQTMEAVNDTLAEILSSIPLKFLTATATFNTVDGQALYPLASDADSGYLLKQTFRRTDDGTTLTEASRWDLSPEQLVRLGTPESFWLEGENLRLYPIPDGNAGIEYSYLKRQPPMINDVDECLLPTRWDFVIIRGAQSRLEKFLGEIDASRLSYALYLEGLAVLKARYTMKPFHSMKGFYRGFRP